MIQLQDVLIEESELAVPSPEIMGKTLGEVEAKDLIRAFYQTTDSPSSLSQLTRTLTIPAVQQDLDEEDE